MNSLTSGVALRRRRQMAMIVRDGRGASSDRYWQRRPRSFPLAITGISDTPCPRATSSWTVKSCVLLQWIAGTQPGGRRDRVAVNAIAMVSRAPEGKRGLPVVR